MNKILDTVKKVQPKQNKTPTSNMINTKMQILNKQLFPTV